MNINIEKEYKVLLTSEQFHSLCNHYPNLLFKKQVNTYYDNKDNDIRKIKGAMRIREVNDTCIFTLKLLKGDDLFEYECNVSSNNIAIFEQAEIQSLLAQHNIHGPFHTLTTLTTYRAMVSNEDAHLCFDENEYNGYKDYEIEYEYQREHDGLSRFNETLSLISLTYTENCPSKIKRALDCLL